MGEGEGAGNEGLGLKPEGFLHFERLGESLEACEKFHRVHEAPGPCRAAHQLFPGEPSQPHGEPFLRPGVSSSAKPTASFPYNQGNRWEQPSQGGGAFPTTRFRSA